MSFLYLLQDMRTPFGECVMSLLTRLGEETVAVAVICVLFWCVDKRVAYCVGASYFFSGLAVQSLKLACKVPRPWVADPSFTPVKSAVPAATGYSFPSGHTQSAGSLYGTAGLLAKNAAVKAALFLTAVAVGFSRMYLGVHTPADVAAGLALSLGVSAAVCALFKRFCDRARFAPALASAVGFFAAASLVYAALLSGESDFGYLADSCKTAGAAFGFALGLCLERRFVNFDTAAPCFAAQAAKAAVGLAVAAGLRAGLKAVLGGGALAGAVRYFAVVMWILVVYPLLFDRVLSGRAARKEGRSDSLESSREA